MKRHPTKPVINRMGPWQLALLLLMLVTFSFYSLPTFFGEQPALGVHASAPLSAQQLSLLEQAGATPLRVVTEPGRQILVFDSAAHQQQARRTSSRHGACCSRTVWMNGR